MSQLVTFQCPSCQKQMQCQAPDGAAEVMVTCPQCSTRSQIRVTTATGTPAASGPTPKASPRRPPAERADPLQTPAPSPYLSTPSPGPKSSTRPKSPARPKKAKGQRGRGISPAIPLSILGVVIVLALAGGAWFLLKDRLPSIASVMDSPKGVLNDVLDLGTELRVTLDSIQDDASRDVAVIKLNELTDRCDRLAVRAAAIGPLDTEEFASLNDWFKSKIPDVSKKTELSAADRKQKRSLFTNGLPTALVDATFAFSNLNEVIQQAWAPIPDPKNDRERVEHEILLLQRKAWVANMTAHEENGDQAAATIDAATEELQAVRERHRDLIESESLFAPGSPYFSKTFQVSTGMSLNVQRQQVVQAAANRFTAEMHDISRSKMETRAQRIEQQTIRARENAMARIQEERAKSRAAAGRTVQTERPPGGQRPDRSIAVPQPDRGSAQSAPRIRIDPNLPPDQAMAARIAAFRGRNSAESTVVVKITREDPETEPREVRVALQQALGIKQHFFASFGDELLLLFVREGPISDLSSQLTMGEVRSTDESSRTIRLHVGKLTR